MARAFQTGDPRAAAYGRLGGQVGAKTKRIRAIQRAVAAVGLDLTPREAAIYRRAYENGYSAGQKTGEARGIRKGLCQALGARYERDRGPMRAGKVS